MILGQWLIIADSVGLLLRLTSLVELIVTEAWKNRAVKHLCVEFWMGAMQNLLGAIFFRQHY